MASDLAPSNRASPKLDGNCLKLARQREPGAGLTDRLMDAAMADAGFKTNLFRFIDVFPSLRTAEQVHQHLREYLYQPGVRLPQCCN